MSHIHLQDIQTGLGRTKSDPTTMHTPILKGLLLNKQVVNPIYRIVSLALGERGLHGFMEIICTLLCSYKSRPLKAKSEGWTVLCVTLSESNETLLRTYSPGSTPLESPRNTCCEQSHWK